jgi:hypothetical protein
MCYNGGCEFTSATRWEPDDGFIGRRVRQLYELLGGDPAELKLEPAQQMTRSEWIKWMLSDKSAAASRVERTATRFPSIALPNGSELLWTALDSRATQAREYVRDRCWIFEDNQYPFRWSPEYPNYVIVPLIYRDENIGWIGRRITGSGLTHLKCTDFPSDFMLNQDHVDYETVLVCEGHFDAIALGCLGTFGSKLTQKQINLLNRSRRRIVLIPDHQKTEWRSYWQTAKDNGWCLSVPPAGAKDVGEAVKRIGLLATLAEIMDGITDDYEAVGVALS